MLASWFTAVMVAIECLEVGSSTISKAAMTRGMNQFVYIVYSNALAIFILLPSTLIFYWKRARPPLTGSIICRIFLLGLVSCCVQMFMIVGIRHSSPTLATAMTDLTPAFTFLLAISSRMEKLDISLQSSQAKSMGTIVSIAGALIVTLYKGMPITGVNNSINDFRSLPSNWAIGGIFCAAGALGIALILIVQAWIIKDYPAELIVTLVACIFVTMLSSIITLIVVQDPNAWTLKPDVKLISIGFSAVFMVSLRSVVHTWACHVKGPLYTAMFKPLGMIIAMVMGVSFLGDTLYVGSLIGAIVIASGFYAVLWGKSQEEKMVEDKGNCCFDCSPKVPLLQNKKMEV